MKLKPLIFVVVSLVSYLSFSQINNNIPIKYPLNVESPLSNAEKAMIEEVYQSQSEALIYNNPKALKDIKHLLRNRILIYKESNTKYQKKTKLLSQIPLNNQYNSNLKRDVVFNKERFNPLKYQLDFFKNGTYLYRIDKTDYFIQVTSQFRVN